MKCTLGDPAIRLWALMPEPITIEWKKDGDEWLHHLFSEFQDRIGASRWGAAGPHVTPEFPALHLEYRLTDADVQSTLVLLLGPNDLRVALAGVEEPSDAEAELWLQALNGAFRRLGRVSHEYRWQAVVGPAAGALNANSELNQTMVVGGLTVRPAEVRLDEWNYGVNSPPSLHAAGRSATWPAIVEGRNAAYSWDVASRLANRAVHRLCVLLSIAMETCWILRTSPQQLVDDSAQLTVPPTIWWQTVDETAQFGPSRPFEPPDWVQQAWNRVASEEYLDDACAIYYEGLLLESEHPSFALIAFISAIETIGGKLFPPARCPECKQVTRSGERFRRALGEVEDEVTVVELAKTYGPRSRTAHSSKLHGHELMRGAFPNPGLFSVGRDFDFRWRKVFAMSRTARKLLLAALTDGLPHGGNPTSDKD